MAATDEEPMEARAAVVDLVETRALAAASPPADADEASSANAGAVTAPSSNQGRQQEQQEEEEKDAEEEMEVVAVESAASQEEQKEQSAAEDEVEVVLVIDGDGADSGRALQSADTSDDDDVVMLKSATRTDVSDGSSSHQRDSAFTAGSAAVVSTGPQGSTASSAVSTAVLEAEFQCIICQYAMFKPVTVFCGHSFCRVCLMDSFLSRCVDEAQCPTCRVQILKPLAITTSPSSIFSVNVTLWNAIQLLVPSVATRVKSRQNEEEVEYTTKLDQLDAKWKIHFLSERAAHYHGDRARDDEDGSHVADSPRGDHSGGGSPRWEEEHSERSLYPVLKVEDSEDGDFHVSRNVVLDTSDSNEDGYQNMRVGLAIMEFPSVFELYNENQECSLNVIKMEEDEEMNDGMPFFMNENGDDDELVCSDYFNQVTLRVCDDGGNCVMERTLGAQRGVVTFARMRLDVPGGMYTFRFSDDLYGLKLSVKTLLREPHETLDTPFPGYITLIQDEARDSRRSRRNGRGHTASDEEEDEVGNESDDSFIVNDLDPEGLEARFSGDEGDNESGGEEQWGYHSDDEQQDEEMERRWRSRRQRQRRVPGRDVRFVEDHSDPAASSDEGDAPVHNDGVDEEENEAENEEDEEGDDHEEVRFVSRTRRRNANHVVDSEDEDMDQRISEPEEETKRQVQVEAVGDDQNEGTADEDEEKGDVGGDGESKRTTRKVTRTEWEEEKESGSEDEARTPSATFSSDEEHKEEEEPPAKRARKVRVIDMRDSENEEEEEQEVTRIVTHEMTSHNGEHEVDDVDGNDDDEEEGGDANGDYPDESEYADVVQQGFGEESDDRGSGDEELEDEDEDEYPAEFSD